jgi:hypothetical protein
MPARRGLLRLNRRSSGAVRCPQFGSKSGVGRTVGRTVWSEQRVGGAGYVICSRRSLSPVGGAGLGWGPKGRWVQIQSPPTRKSRARVPPSGASPGSPQRTHKSQLSGRSARRLRRTLGPQAVSSYCRAIAIRKRSSGVPLSRLSYRGRVEGYGSTVLHSRPGVLLRHRPRSISLNPDLSAGGLGAVSRQLSLQ